MTEEAKGVAAPVDRISIKYAATYYFLSQLDQFVTDDLVLDRYLSDYFETAIWDYIIPFRKWTALHMFSSLFADMVLDADFSRAAGLVYVRQGSCKVCGSYPRSAAHLLAADLCRIHEIEASTLDEALEGWVLTRDCCLESGESMDDSILDDAWSSWKLEEGHEQLLAQIAEEMFFVLFANRSFLRRFNRHMASRIRWLSPEEDDPNLLYVDRQGNTRLTRTDPPEWAKRAVFFRDRGYCCGCGRNLENSRSPINRVQFDHIVPLAAGGMNDVSNLQLLCESCNGRKRDKITEASELYERWYKIDREYGPRTADTLQSVILDLFTDNPNA
jgi:5-methylcytosine-specific restriction endonuclease McrA